MSAPLERARRVASFAAVYAGRFLVANAHVLAEVLTPGTGVAPALLLVPLRCRTDLEVSAVVWLVGLTPGTLVVRVDDARVDGGGVAVGVHVMHARDVEAARAELLDVEDRLLRALRPVAEDPGPRRALRAGGVR